MKKIIIFSVVSIFALFFIPGVGSHIYNYKFNRCIYTEEILIIPDELVRVELNLENNTYMVKGDSSNHCTKILKGVSRELISNIQLKNNYINLGNHYNKGIITEPISMGKSFKLEKIIAETKHGFSTIDSGNGPLYYLILKDEQGLEYKLIYTNLGKDGVFLTYNYNNQKKYLGSLYINHLYGNNQNGTGKYYKESDYFIKL
jgi:hypothetical protein